MVDFKAMRQLLDEARQHCEELPVKTDPTAANTYEALQAVFMVLDGLYSYAAYGNPVFDPGSHVTLTRAEYDALVAGDRNNTESLVQSQMRLADEVECYRGCLGEFVDQTSGETHLECLKRLLQELRVHREVTVWLEIDVDAAEELGPHRDERRIYYTNGKHKVILTDLGMKHVGFGDTYGQAAAQSLRKATGKE